MISQKPVRTVAPALPLVTVAEARVQCRVDGTDEDVLLSALIQAATDHLDGYSGVLGRALLTQTWKITLDCWPCDRIRLPLSPVQSITSVKYYDGSNVQQTWAGSNYALLEDALSPYVGWLSDVSLPSVYDRNDAIEVIFVAGYGSGLGDVPDAIRLAAKMLVGHWYENREAVVIGQTPAAVPLAVDALLSPYRRIGL